jgi:AraC-like DNA-binding protein
VPARPEDIDLGRVMAYAVAHLQHVDIDTLAAEAGLSRRTFDRRFRVQAGVSPLQWLLHQRILRAQNLLECTDLTVDAIARQVGLATAVSLRPAFRRIVGMSPQAYRRAFRLDDAHVATPGHARADGEFETSTDRFQPRRDPSPGGFLRSQEEPGPVPYKPFS